MSKMKVWITLVAISLQAFGNAVILASCDGGHGWGCIEETDDTNGEAGQSNSASGSNWSWSWSISGSKGSFTANATADPVDSIWSKPTVATATHSASGWIQQRVGSWDGGTESCTEPDDGCVTGQGDGTVSCSVHMDANNGDIDSGSCAALAHGKVIFSGIADGSIDINLNSSFSEGDTEISGTLSASKEGVAGEVEISTTVGSDIADAQSSDSISLSEQYCGGIAGQLEKGYGYCSVMARANNGAYESTANVSTTIDTVDVTGDSGGSTECGEQSCNVAAPSDC